MLAAGITSSKPWLIVCVPRMVARGDALASGPQPDPGDAAWRGSFCPAQLVLPHPTEAPDCRWSDLFYTLCCYQAWFFSSNTCLLGCSGSWLQNAGSFFSCSVGPLVAAWELFKLWHVESSSLNRDRTQGAHTGIVELSHWIPTEVAPCLLWVLFSKEITKLLMTCTWRNDQLEIQAYLTLLHCSPWGRSESDRTERLHFYFSPSCIGEGNGTPLQYSCLENPRDGEPGGLPSMGLHRVRHDWSHSAAAEYCFVCLFVVFLNKWKVCGNYVVRRWLTLFFKQERIFKLRYLHFLQKECYCTSNRL